MFLRRSFSAALLALWLASGAWADDVADGQPAPEQALIRDACEVERTCMMRLDRLELARIAADRAGETDRVNRIKESQRRVEDWRDARIREMREGLSSDEARAELERCLQSVRDGESAEPKPASGTEAAPSSRGATAGARRSDGARATSGPLRRTSDPKNVRGRVRHNPMGEVGTVVILPGRGAEPRAESEVHSDSEVEPEPVTTTDGAADEASAAPQPTSSTQVRRTPKGNISIVVPGGPGPMTGATRGRR